MGEKGVQCAVPARRVIVEGGNRGGHRRAPNLAVVLRLYITLTLPKVKPWAYKVSTCVHKQIEATKRKVRHLLR